MMIKIVYNDKMLSEDHEISPSAIKPKLLVECLWRTGIIGIEIVEPEPVTVEDFKRCHDSKYVDDILSLKRPNGFGTYSQKVVDSLPYTSGSLYTACRIALETKKPVCSPTSGFHHAGYDRWEGLGWFCTFNGLMVAATKLVAEGLAKRIAIVDCDAHWGNGTDDILLRIDKYSEKYLNISFGRYPYHKPPKSINYLNSFEAPQIGVRYGLKEFQPDLIIYQAGADTHINDPIGDGILTEEEMYERDIKMFTITKSLNIPICWNLAGGYQRDNKGGCDYVLKLHINTFKACNEVYGEE